MTSPEEFDQWMKNYGTNYINEFGILINKEPEIIFISSPWPDHGNSDELSIILLCANGRDVFEVLDIQSADELEQLQPETMLSLFYEGQAIVLCTTQDGDSLQFQKGSNAMIAVIDGVDLGHEVKEPLIMPGDFIRYTNECFRILKAQSKNESKGS